MDLGGPSRPGNGKLEVGQVELSTKVELSTTIEPSGQSGGVGGPERPESAQRVLGRRGRRGRVRIVRAACSSCVWLPFFFPSVFLLPPSFVLSYWVPSWPSLSLLLLLFTTPAAPEYASRRRLHTECASPRRLGRCPPAFSPSPLISSHYHPDAPNSRYWAQHMHNPGVYRVNEERQLARLVLRTGYL
jgi:hypothetical protein